MLRSSQVKQVPSDLRTLITGPDNQVNVALAEWLVEFEGICVVGIETRTMKALVLAESLKPDVVLLDFETEHGITLNSVHLFREIDPVPRIVMLAHQVTGVIRRCCKEQGVTLVCRKTGELDRLPSILLALQK